MSYDKYLYNNGRSKELNIALLNSIFPFTVMITIRLRNCWTGAGQCSGSRWPPAGSVSSSTCGPSSLPWCAQSASRPRPHITKLESGFSDSWHVARQKLSHWAKGPPQAPFYLETQPITTLSIRNWRIIYCLFCLYASVSFTLIYNVKMLIPWWWILFYFFIFYYQLLLEFCFTYRSVKNHRTWVTSWNTWSIQPL